MRPAFLKLLVVALAALSAAAVYRHVTKSANNPSSGVPREVISLYSSWKQTHGKLYATPAENDHRLRVFYSQKLFVDQANADYINLKLERDGEVISQAPFTLNAFADLSSEEFTAKYTGEVEEDNEFAESAPEVPMLESADAGLAQSTFDVRIRNQGSCGSCWAFSAIATYEKFYFMKTGQRVDLSQQHMVDCDTTDSGCNGGLSSNALTWLSGKGSPLASAYPYTASKGVCKSVATTNKLTFSVNRPTFSTSYATDRISAGHLISVSVYASGKFRYLDSSDTPFDASATGECSQTKNHAINAVSSSSGNLRLLNSWGTSWGNKGLKWVKPCSATKLWADLSYVTTPQ